MLKNVTEKFRNVYVFRFVVNMSQLMNFLYVKHSIYINLVIVFFYVFVYRFQNVF